MKIAEHNVSVKLVQSTLDESVEVFFKIQRNCNGKTRRQKDKQTYHYEKVTRKLYYTHYTYTKTIIIGKEK